jgi:hypothetical protein
MSTRLALFVVLIVGTAAPALRAQAVTVEDVLARAGEYVVHYQHDFAGVVAEETYTQDARSPQRFNRFGSLKGGVLEHRELKSDLLLVRPQGGDQWIQFRDVFQVDGRAVRDRSDRLAKLFLQPSTTTARQAAQISKESARYNVGTVIRNVNVPVLALWVLLPANQHRFLFNHVDEADAGRSDGAWAIDYREVAPGTMIRTSGGQDLPVTGRFWIEPATGAVLESVLAAEDRQVSARIEVTYEPEPALHMLLPRTMRESYVQNADGATVSGLATYANFRQFQVKVDEKIAPIKP